MKRNTADRVFQQPDRAFVGMAVPLLDDCRLVKAYSDSRMLLTKMRRNMRFMPESGVKPVVCAGILVLALEMGYAGRDR